MLDILRQAKNVISVGESALRVHTSNISNLSTYGYKSTQYSFVTLFNQIQRHGYISSGRNYNPVQIGPNVTISGLSYDFTQGDFVEGGALDVGINGNGFFILSPDNGKSFVFSRAGRFKTDSQGNLIDPFGRKLYGFKTDSSGNTTSTHLVPIKTEGKTDVGFVLGGIFAEGYETYKKAVDSGATTLPTTPALYKVALTDFRNRSGLLQTDGSAYKQTLTSGSSFTPGASGTSSYGTVEAQRLEKSNVFLIGEEFDSTEVQRVMSATQTIAKVAGDFISSMIEKL
jgi:flagellar hook protein FlgE